MYLGYNTNGFAHHRLADAATILAEIGYQGIAITLEREVLDPPDARGVPAAVRILKPILAASGLRPTIETGSRFLLDPRRKHQPTLLSKNKEGRQYRLNFLRAAVEIAAEVGAKCVSLWSGTPDDDGFEAERVERLRHGLDALLETAEPRDVRLGFEPEPGMAVETMAQFRKLHEEFNHPLLGLTLDVGHIHCLNDGHIAAHVAAWSSRLWNVHLEDMRRGVHEHLPFGKGELNVPDVLRSLSTAGYTGPVHVELSRHSHDAVNVAQASFKFLQPLIAPRGLHST